MHSRVKPELLMSFIKRGDVKILSIIPDDMTTEEEAEILLEKAKKAAKQVRKPIKKNESSKSEK
jgi:hypothetical protein